MSAIGLFAATRWEVEAVRRGFSTTETRAIGTVRCLLARRPHIDWWIIPMGVGLERAAATARLVLAEQQFAAVWSTGFACALRAAEVGDVLMGTAVALESSPHRQSLIPCFPPLIEWAQQALKQPSMHIGSFVSSSTVLCRADEKRKLADRCGAIGLDMESAAVGAAATQHQVPFGILRTVSDLVDEDLPLDFNLFLRPSGWAKGVAACFAHPASFIGLNRLRHQSRKAGAQLTALYRACADLPSMDAVVC